MKYRGNWVPGSIWSNNTKYAKTSLKSELFWNKYVLFLTKNTHYWKGHSTLRTPRWVVCKQHARDWQTRDFALLEQELTILKRVWWFWHKKRLQSTQDIKLIKVSWWEESKMAPVILQTGLMHWDSKSPFL